MNNLKAILVDDEISNLKGLEKKLITLFPSIDIVGRFQEPEAAIKELNTTDIDILFLDIEMPRINGFQLLTALKKINFQIIFVTAYSEYAIDAFKQNAIDYILKPIDNDELKIAVRKAIENVQIRKEKYDFENLSNMINDIITQNNRIIVPTQEGISFLSEEDVLHFEGYNGYTRIFLKNDVKITSSYNLGKFEKSLSNRFFKCHKSHIVNLGKVERFENEGYLIVSENHRIPISKTNRKVFLALYK